MFLFMTKVSLRNTSNNESYSFNACEKNAPEESMIKKSMIQYGLMRRKIVCENKRKVD